MKKHLSLFVPLLALFLALSPQTARATNNNSEVDPYLTQPLTIEKGTSGTFGLKFYRADANSGSTKVTINLQYRTSVNGAAWGAWTDVCVAGTNAVSIFNSTGHYLTATWCASGKAGKIQLRGVNPDGFSKSTTDYYQISIESSGTNVTVYGNVMSLIKGYDTDNETAAQAALAAADEIPNEYCFYGLFKKKTSSMSNVSNLDMEHLIFPATKLKSNCYNSLLYGWANSSNGVKKAPTFLATDFVDKDNKAVSSSFANLCYNCSTLTTIHVNLKGFSECYAQDNNNLSNWLYNCTKTGSVLYAPSDFGTCASNRHGWMTESIWNARWSNSSWSYDFVSHIITFKDANGAVVETKEVTEGSIPTYTGTTNLNIQGKVLKWSPALVAATADATYQAYYVDEPDYLTLTNTSASNATVYFRRQNGNNSNTINIEWSINGGAWSDPRTNKYDNYAAISVPAGQNVRFRGNNTVIDGGVTKCKFSPSSSIYWNITSTNGSFVVSGDVMSLAAYDEANTCIHNEYPLYNYCFYSLFRSGSNNAFTSMRDASGLKLSATLGAYCYQNMFYNCTNLTTAPVLPATTLAQSCYASMFQGCSALTTAPALPAMTLADNCYDAMFQTCTSLTQTPALPATTLASNCYRNMFNGCIALTTTVDVLPALDLPPSCYYYMYNGCTSLVKAPDIEATTMSGSSTNQQCSNMFAGCTALTKAPSVLKVESGLKTSCYNNMFLGCSNLERSPDIKATSLGSQSFYSMFKSCTKLNIIRTYHTAWGSYPTSDWVYGVADEGVIYCPPTLPRTYYNNTQMPKSSTYPWTVFSYNITFVPKSCSWTDETNANKQFTWETDTTNVMTFLRAESADNAKFYTDAACTEEISIEAIKAYLEEQQEASAATTKNYYVQKVSSYTLDWDANGGELSGDYTAAGSYSAGAEIIAPNATRAGYTYTWNPAFTGTMPAANTTYIAQWTQKSYTLNATASAGGSGVTRSDNGNSETVKRYNDAVVLTPVANTGYHFTDWTGTDASDLVDNEDGTYTLTIADKADNYEYAVTAHFAPNTHRLTWTTDGNTLTGDYTHGEAIAYGTTITAPNTPTKNATAQYTYTFNGWEPALDATMPDNDVTYTATWTETKRQYTLTWDVNGGNALTGTYTNGTIDWGTDIVKPADPTKDGYAFNGWDANNDGKADEVAETMPTTSLTYKAIWVAELPNITLCENCNNDYYNTFKSDYDRKTVNVTYPRQFSASKWSTMCLPFSIELPEMIAQKMYGRVYEFKYATGNANTNSGVNLYFSNAKKIEAGTCYIVNANDALAAKTSFVFSGVTIDLTNDKGAALTSVGAYDNLPGYLSEGKIELVGTLRNGTLKGSATGNKYMGLKNNKIYYPNTDTGSTIWAYRGIFRSSEILDKESMQKMRIIVDGEDRGELIIDEDGEILDASGDAPSRKFIRDGVLYIEREGVVYDAQGKRVESSF